MEPWHSTPMVAAAAGEIMNRATTAAGEIPVLVHPGLNVLVACDSGIVHADIERAIRDGWYELEECRAAEAVIRADDRVLELGGGLGAVAAHVWKVCRPASYSVYEVNPELLPLLLETLRRNDVVGVSVHHRLLTDNPYLLRQGSVEFFVPERFWAGSTVPPQTSCSTIVVPTSSFSRCIGTLRPTVIICDIEGGEFDLFVNRRPRHWLNRIFGSPFLDGVRAIILEAHEQLIGADKIEAIKGALRADGFHSVQEVDRLIVMSRRLNI